MWKHNQEVIDAVEAFNEKVHNSIGDESEFSSDHMMTFESNSYSTIIKFMGLTLWSSDDDEREYIEAHDKYEPLLQFLERQFKRQLELFSRLLPKAQEMEENKPFQVGDFVCVSRSFANPLNGRIKAVGTDHAWVVYNCAGEWHRYKDFTGERTSLGVLSHGWIDNEGNPIDTPEIE